MNNERQIKDLKYKRVVLRYCFQRTHRLWGGFITISSTNAVPDCHVSLLRIPIHCMLSNLEPRAQRARPLGNSKQK